MMKKLLSLLLMCALMTSACSLALADNVLRPGDKGDNVKQLQQLLANYGYYTGAIDGVYGSGTTAAVERFQRYNDLKKDGKAGPNTMAKLTGSSVVHAPVADNSAADADIKYIQQRLAHYGFYKGAVDGVYGDATIAAVKAFQGANELQKDGAVGEKTLAKLQSDTAVSQAQLDAINNAADAHIKYIQQRLTHYGFYKGAVDGVYGNATIAAVKAFQDANDLQKDGAVGEKTLAMLQSDTAVSQAQLDAIRAAWLQKGSEGAEVSTLQQHLKDTLYYTGSIDGIFGDEVHAAVVEFQQSAGIQADGIVGDSTKNALYNRAAAIFNGGTPVRALYTGRQGYDVKVLQQRLSALNYYNAPVTGYFNDYTAAAVKAFQKDNGMDPDGKVDAIVRRYLWPASSENTPDDYPKLTFGATGTYVSQAQMRLKAAGFLSDTADGVFGENTLRAVKAFQKSRKLTVDGKIGQNTWAELMRVNMSGAEPEPTKPLSLVLRPGAKGGDVWELQRNLVALNYKVVIDGKYGAETTAAVKAFQQAHNLTVDGKAGPKTLTKINQLLSK